MISAFREISSRYSSPRVDPTLALSGVMFLPAQSVIALHIKKYGDRHNKVGRHQNLAEY